MAKNYYIFPTNPSNTTNCYVDILNGVLQYCDQNVLGMFHPHKKKRKSGCIYVCVIEINRCILVIIEIRNLAQRFEFTVYSAS